MSGSAWVGFEWSAEQLNDFVFFFSGHYPYFTVCVFPHQYLTFFVLYERVSYVSSDECNVLSSHLQIGGGQCRH